MKKLKKKKPEEPVVPPQQQVKKKKTKVDRTVLPEIILKAYKEENHIPSDFHFFSDEVLVVTVTDTVHPRWLAVDSWKIHSYSEDWAMGGRTTLHYANTAVL